MQIKNESLPYSYINLKTFTGLIIAYSIYFPIFFFANVPFGLTAIQHYSKGEKLLDVEFFYTAAQAYERLTLFGEQGRSIYLNILKADLIYPIFLNSLLITSIILITRKLNLFPNYQHFFILPPLANLLFDYSENGLLFSLLLFYPTHLPAIATMAGLATLLKNVSGFVAFLVLILGILFLLLQRLKAMPKIRFFK